MFGGNTKRKNQRLLNAKVKLRKYFEKYLKKYFAYFAEKNFYACI